MRFWEFEVRYIIHHPDQWCTAYRSTSVLPATSDWTFKLRDNVVSGSALYQVTLLMSSRVCLCNRRAGSRN
jgi:hypothetical protein